MCRQLIWSHRYILVSVTQHHLGDIYIRESKMIISRFCSILIALCLIISNAFALENVTTIYFQGIKSSNTESMCLHDITGKEVTNQQPLISVLIPSYEGGSFISNTLESVFEQTYSNLEILVSVDLSNDNTLSVVKRLQRSNVVIFAQHNRLGWVKNTNFLLRQATGDYVSILAHDDTIPRNYYSALLTECMAHPQAVNCYPYIFRVQDGRHNLMHQNGIMGTTVLERVSDVIKNHVSATSHRGLMRRSVGQYSWSMPEDQHLDMLGDTTSVLQQAIAGELVPVDVPYFKSYSKKTVLASWNQQNDSDIALGWADHCANLYKKSVLYADSTAERKKLLSICKKRLNIHWSRAYLKRVGENATQRQVIRNISNTRFEERVFKEKKQHVSILGGGIQGCSMALLFHKHGYDVTIIDNSTDIMNRASMNQEGKIHMGFVYSNDPSLKTGEYMMRSALTFGTYMEYLLDETVDWATLKSTRFQYLVPHDSLLSPDELEVYFSKLQGIYEDIIRAEPHLSYLGERPSQIYKRIPLPPHVNQTYFAGCFETEEYAISQTAFRDYVKKAIMKKGIRVVLNHFVTGVHTETDPSAYTVTTDKGSFQFDVVVNCLWEGRRDVDRTVGLPDWSGNNARLKFGVKTGYIDELRDVPSVTIVNGPFGDFVNYPRDKRMYFSWYPVSILGMIVDQPLPEEWKAIANGDIAHDMATYQIQQHLLKFQELFPVKAFQFNCPKLVGGIVIASGKLGIHQTNSELHARSDNPIMKKSRYFSVSTQKFTSGPYHASLMEKKLASLLR